MPCEVSSSVSINVFILHSQHLIDGPLFSTGVNLLMHICPGGGAKQPSDHRQMCEHFLKRLSLLLLWLN